MIQTGWSLHLKMFHLICNSLAKTNGRDVCHQNESRTSTLCLPVPDANSLDIDAFEHLVGGSRRLCLLSCSTHSKSHSTSEHLQVQMIVVAHDALVLGSGESVNQTSITATSLVSETAMQSEIPSEFVALLSCLAP